MSTNKHYNHCYNANAVRYIECNFGNDIYCHCQTGGNHTKCHQSKVTQHIAHIEYRAKQIVHSHSDSADPAAFALAKEQNCSCWDKGNQAE